MCCTLYFLRPTLRRCSFLFREFTQLLPTVCFLFLIVSRTSNLNALNSLRLTNFFSWLVSSTQSYTVLTGVVHTAWFSGFSRSAAEIHSEWPLCLSCRSSEKKAKILHSILLPNRRQAHLQDPALLIQMFYVGRCGSQMWDNSSSVKMKHQKVPSTSKWTFEKMFWQMFLTVLNITFILASDLWKKRCSVCDAGCYFLLSPSSHLQLHAVHSIIFLPSPSSLKYFSLLSSEEVVFWEVLGPGCASVCALLCPWIYKHVPSISSFHRQGLCGRQISSFPLCLSKLSSSLSNFPPQRPTRTHFTHLRETQPAPFPPSP